MSQVRPAPEQGRFQYSVLPASGARVVAVLLGAMAVAPCIAGPSLPLPTSPASTTTSSGLMPDPSICRLQRMQGPRSGMP